jgi:hypothetical protein
MTLRRAAKVDRNQPEIVEAFRKMGCSVLHTSQLKNCCDLFVARGKTAAIEIQRRLSTQKQAPVNRRRNGLHAFVERAVFHCGIAG